MSESGETGRGVRERIATGAEDKLGRALSDLLESPLLSGAIGRAFDARERAAQAQELAMGALNLPSAADIERLTRRLRSVSQRLEGIEDGVDRLDRATGQRLAAIEEQLQTLGRKLEEIAATPAVSASAGRGASKGTPSGGSASAKSRKPSRGASTARKASGS